MKVLSVSVEAADPKDPAFRKLDRRWRFNLLVGWIPFLGPWLIRRTGNCYVAVYDK
ncbi:MAG: hypothetical protein HZB70_02785 [Candidatus Berkelbacteria bacterium]|nr:MAG: hypothetical protein HZB70_02785 [Candidatus Berkelbacteria bacterium]QQG51769.1 MAG: hypothetical protein HY845_00210 [Candidatus Berkelbacteria bacterium]